MGVLIIVIVIIVIVWLLNYQNQNNADTKFKNAAILVGKKKFDEAQEALFKLISEHPMAVKKYAECFFIKAEELKNKGNISEAITNYKRVLDSKNLLTSTSDRPSFYKLAESAFYEISELQFNSISSNGNSLVQIKALKTNLNFIKNSEFNKSKKIPKLIEKHNKIIKKLYFELGQNEEKKGNLIQASNNYSNALTYANKNYSQYFNIVGRIELCKIKLNKNIELENVNLVDKAKIQIRNDFYFRYALHLFRRGKFAEVEKIIYSQKLDLKNPEVKKLEKLIQNEKIKSAIKEITNINNQIKEIYNKTASIDLLISLYDSLKFKESKFKKIIPDISNEIEKLKPSLFNRILQYYYERNKYWKAINTIIKFPDFYNSPLLMKNLGNTSFNLLQDNGLTLQNYRIIISLFLTSAYSDKVILTSLEETVWDDEYTFSLIDSVGSNYELHSEIPENVNYDEITESNISIGEAQKYLISEFENLLNEKVAEYALPNEVFKFYHVEKQSIENIIQIIPNEIVFATPYFAKRFNISNQIIDELEHDFSEYKNEESLKTGIPYLNDNRDLWINDYFEAKKTIDALIDSIYQVDNTKFSNSLTASRKKLIYKFETLVESMESRAIDSLSSITKKQSASENVLDLIKKTFEIVPNNGKLKYLYSSYAANLCVTKINSDKMTIYKGLKIMSNAYKISPNDLRTCTNIIALIRMNILSILNDKSTDIISIYSILDEIKENRSTTFKNNAGELLKARNEILNSLPSEARIAIISGANLNNSGRQLKKGLGYLAQLGGTYSTKDPWTALRESLELDLPF